MSVELSLRVRCLFPLELISTVRVPLPVHVTVAVTMALAMVWAVALVGARVLARTPP